MIENENKITSILPREELLCQLAEEAAELGKAALKLRRVTEGSNPTPVTYDDALSALYEETADVLLCLHLAGVDVDGPFVKDTMERKYRRWWSRLGGETHD